MNLKKNIWKDWTVQDYITELEPHLEIIMTNQSRTKPFTSITELEIWCIDNQPYYRKPIPEVIAFFSKKHNIKS